MVARGGRSKGELRKGGTREGKDRGATGGAPPSTKSSRPSSRTGGTASGRDASEERKGRGRGRRQAVCCCCRCRRCSSSGLRHSDTRVKMLGTLASRVAVASNQSLQQCVASAAAGAAARGRG
eukprot:91917-Chlamydomonas_euryale.AAC.4